MTDVLAAAASDLPAPAATSADAALQIEALATGVAQTGFNKAVCSEASAQFGSTPDTLRSIHQMPGVSCEIRRSKIANSQLSDRSLVQTRIFFGHF
ncbi:hypothetical protein ACFQX4_13895 [Roseomonas sp. GCM10028921]